MRSSSHDIVYSVSLLINNISDISSIFQYFMGSIPQFTDAQYKGRSINDYVGRRAAA